MPANNALGFKRFDIFKKMPRDLTEPTIFGALGKFKETPFSFFVCFSVCSLHCGVGGLDDF
jgi:hypothetical protein